MTEPTAALPQTEQTADARTNDATPVTLERIEPGKRTRPPLKNSCDCCCS